MEHETEYAVWKAFVRNMDFLRKRLTAMVEEDDDLDQDIYLVSGIILFYIIEIFLLHDVIHNTKIEICTFSRL